MSNCSRLLSLTNGPSLGGEGASHCQFVYVGKITWKRRHPPPLQTNNLIILHTLAWYFYRRPIANICLFKEWNVIKANRTVNIGLPLYNNISSNTPTPVHRPGSLTMWKKMGFTFWSSTCPDVLAMHNTFPTSAAAPSQWGSTWTEVGMGANGAHSRLPPGAFAEDANGNAGKETNPLVHQGANSLMQTTTRTHSSMCADGRMDGRRFFFLSLSLFWRVTFTNGNHCRKPPSSYIAQSVR